MNPAINNPSRKLHPRDQVHSGRTPESVSRYCRYRRFNALQTMATHFSGTGGITKSRAAAGCFSGTNSNGFTLSTHSFTLDGATCNLTLAMRAAG